MKMINLNSQISISKEDELFIGGRAGELSPLLFKIPVYWVDPDLMDRIYPPKRRRFLHPGCAKEMLELFEKSEDMEIEALFERLERCRDWSGGFVAVGLYMRYPDERTREIIEEETGKEIPECPSIFISPERVMDWAKEASSEIPFFEQDWGFRFFLAKVLVHELAHAYMDGGKNQDTFWERVIEESLANAFAYCNVAAPASDAERLAFEKVTSKQPIEYQGWRYFATNPEGYSLSLWSKAWKNRSTPHMGPAYWIPGLLWTLPEHVRHRLARILRWELPHPWDEFFYIVLREYPRRAKVVQTPREHFWPYLALTMLKMLV